ncbi:RdgB/HAM1 family non-canonical purine NTP pyrophosphatase [Candidatus Dojkabacteria bacterium]|jgi:XTP/dITP diphosphohydrolase|nr:RdgB/HAM1 family non-canonical purine NTP pyrophosphatase [Candidatus Dojkabacteria bacterium]
MNKAIYFGTTSEGKLSEARSIFKCEIIGTPLKIDEIQSLDVVDVATKKARGYFKELNKPVFIEDVGLFFEELNGLPGAYINDFYDALGNQGLIDLLKGRKNRKALAKTVIVFIDESGIEHVFEGEISGRISENILGEKGWGWDPIFIPDGSDKTFAQMPLQEKNKYSMRAQAMEKFKKYLDRL